MPGMEKVMDREDPEKEEEGEGYPRTPSRLFHRHRKSPKGKEDGQKEDQSFEMEGRVKMA
jgi:hypothetical protein